MLGGTEGILNKYHKKWYVFYLQTEQTTVRVYIPNSILARLSPVKKIRFSTLEGVGLEAMMSKVSFAADPKSRLIKADLTIFPIYNNAAVQIAANTDFDPGEILNPGETWVRLVLENPDIVYLNWPNNNHRRSQHNDVVLYFYYDQAMTQPRDVSGLRVRITQYYKGMNVENYSQPILTFTASGVRFVPLAGTEIYYINNSGEYRTWEYVLADSENGEYFRI